MDWRQLAIENVETIQKEKDAITVIWSAGGDEVLAYPVESAPQSVRVETLLACWNCMKQDETKHFHRKAHEYGNDETECDYNVLFARVDDQDASGGWTWIRDRAYQAFLFSVQSRNDGVRDDRHSTSCRVPDAFCHVPHSPLEELLWAVEAERKFDFDIFRYIDQKRSENNGAGSYFFAKYQGHVRLLCGICWNDDTVELDALLAADQCAKHARDKMVPFHMQCTAPQDRQELFPLLTSGSKQQASSSGPIGLCQKLAFCPNRESCPFYHSFLERDLATKLATAGNNWELELRSLCPQQEVGETGSHGEAAVEKKNEGDEKQDLDVTDKCPFLLRGFCSTCWHSEPQQQTALIGTCRCSLSGHDTKDNVVVCAVSSESGQPEAFVPVRPLHQKYMQPNAKVSKLCKYSRKGTCKKDLCEFPHSKEEIVVWKWLLRQTNQDLIYYALANASDEDVVPERCRNAVESTERTVVSPWKPGKSTPTCKACMKHCFGRLRRLFCQFCNKACNDPKQLADHINTLDHIRMIRTDKELTWQFRDVWNGDRLELCSAGEECYHSDFCMDAHSEEELIEWQDRCRYRDEKKNTAIESNLYIYDYIDTLRQQNFHSGYYKTLEALDVTCKETLVRCLQKGKSCRWNFTVKVKSSDDVDVIQRMKSLKVALLENKDRMYFDLSTGMAEHGKFQMLNSDQLAFAYETAEFHVNFRPGGYGSFKQSVILECRSSELVVQHLSVEVDEYGPESNSTLGLTDEKWQPDQFRGDWFLATNGREVSTELDSSLYNSAEVSAVFDVIKSIQNTFDMSTKIAVLTSYSEQVKRIQQKLTTIESIYVTVQQTQDGSSILNLNDYNVVVISAVKSNYNNWNSETNCDIFLHDIILAKRIILDESNYDLVVVGDPILLSCKWSCARVWRKFIQKCSEQRHLAPSNFRFDLIPFYAEYDDKPNGRLSCEDILRQLAGNSLENPTITPRIKFDADFKHLAVISTDESGEDILEWKSRVDRSLLEKLREQPNDGTRYAHCHLKIHKRDHIDALDLRRDGESYKIKKRKHCQSAFNEDQLLLQITGDDVEVLGVVQPYIDDEDRFFLCRADRNEHRFGTVLPGSPSLPRLHALMKAEHAEEAKKLRKLAVYKIENNLLKFDCFVDIEGTNSPMLEVKFLKWKVGRNYPIGLITGITSEDLKIQQVSAYFGIPTRFQRNELNEADRIYRHHRNIDWLEHRFLEARKNLTDLDCFTVDSKQAKDLDDALSIEDNENIVRIGVHIADVSFFIEKGSSLDIEAYNRGSTVFARNRTYPKINMLPERLSEDLCSLLPGKRRPVLSIFFDWDKAENKMLKPTIPIRAIIRSRRQLSYEDLKKELHFETLSMIAKNINFEGANPPCLMSPNEIVQAFMYRTNRHITELLFQCYPDCAPHVVASQALAQNISEKKTARTSHVERGPRQTQKQTKNGAIQITESDWKDIQRAADEGDTIGMRTLLGRSLSRVTQSPEIKDSKENKVRGKQYRCTVSRGTDTSRLHTTFTSPIRRYFDLIVHRYIVSGLIEENSPAPPYDLNRLQEMCDYLSLVELRHSDYDHERHSLALAIALKKRSCTAFPIVEWCNESTVGLRFASLDDRPPETQKVGFNVLGLCITPRLQRGVSTTTITLNWEIRYLNYRPLTASLESCDTKLVEIPENCWKSIITGNNSNLQTISKENFSSYSIADFKNEQTRYFMKIERQIKVGNVVQVQLTSEVTRGKPQSAIQQFCLTPYLQICVQHQADPLRCFAVTETAQASKLRYASVEKYQDAWLPVVRMDAVDTAVAQPGGATISGIQIKWWRVGEKDVRGMFEIDKKFCHENDVFNINDFALESTVNSREDGVASSSDSNSNVPYKDLFCVRYNGSTKGELQRLTQLQDSVTRDEEESVVLDSSDAAVSWVGHCVGIGTTASADFVTVSLVLHQSSNNFPPQLLANGESFMCTVEWLPSSTPAVRREVAVCTLHNSSSFIQDIILNPKITDDESEGGLDCDELINDSKLNLPKPNKNQAEAIEASLRQKFSLIQGPPGTGKTTTGVQLAYHLAQLNRRRDNGGKVLYCCPTNAAVDLVACMLQRLKTDCPDILRIYGEGIESEEFPRVWAPKPPRRMSRRRPQVSDPESTLKHIALHHRIREALNPFSKKIKDYDHKFSKIKYRSDVSVDDIKGYQNAVLRATWHEIDKASIILCTCSAAGSPKLAIERHIYSQIATSENNEEMKPWQIIIDECSMCTEPETLIPLVAHSKKIKKVVLIGDHKQLQPVVLCRAAENANLNKSLFERSVENNKVDPGEQNEKGTKKVILLEEQYRMHEAICEFPSKEFYEDRLRTATNHDSDGIDKIWPGGPNIPLVFCNMKGREMTQYVATAEFSEMSKSNPDEARLAVNIAEILVNKFKIQADKIAILSYYRAQEREIVKNLEKERCSNVGSYTVVLSQGNEWDYVILSCVRSNTDEIISKRENRDSHAYIGWLRSFLGFVINGNQMNVAITRAKKGLIIIGNKYLLECDEKWERLIKHYSERSSVVEGLEFLRRLENF